MNKLAQNLKIKIEAQEPASLTNKKLGNLAITVLADYKYTAGGVQCIDHEKL